MFRAGVRAELGDAVDLVGEADEVDAAIELISERVPDVVLLDVHLPGGGGQAVLAGVLPHHPEVRFLALSVSDAPEDVIAVIRAGARGYVTKTISGAELLAGGAHGRGRRRRLLPPAGRVRAGCLRRTRRGPIPASGLDPELDQLSPREREVLRLIARGYTYKEVARDLAISTKTVETHVSSGAAQAAAVHPARAHPLGHRAPARMLTIAPVARRPSVTIDSLTDHPA